MMNLVVKMKIMYGRKTIVYINRTRTRQKILNRKKTATWSRRVRRAMKPHEGEEGSRESGDYCSSCELLMVRKIRFRHSHDTGSLVSMTPAVMPTNDLTTGIGDAVNRVLVDEMVSYCAAKRSSIFDTIFIFIS